MYTNAEVELEHTLKTIKWKRIEEQYALWNWLAYISGASKSCYDEWWCNLNYTRSDIFNLNHQIPINEDITIFIL
ncbi:hypothetical protein BK141_00905 [Paenibacillus sp. FSL R5-0765]|nr:hypothetical protein BK141_00905 [Paenibacillus sp. FSL R5-0765]